MRVGEIMTHAVKTVGPREPAHLAFEAMQRLHVHHLVVMEGKQVLGVVSERDLGGRSGMPVREGHTVGELMTRDVVVASEGTTVRQAANLLRGRNIGCLPVVEGGRLVGIVTVTDLLELVSSSVRRASTDARWKPVRRMGRWPRTAGPRHAH
jgi:acetoin utilization protein AcuB